MDNGAARRRAAATSRRVKVARPGDRPSVDILVFSSDAERSLEKATIGADGQVRAQGCGVRVDRVATPHVFRARNVLLFIAADDEAELAAVRTAASSLGGDPLYSQALVWGDLSA